jgi:phage-related protein
MATQIGLGVQFTANASGMTKGLSQVDRQLQKLGQQASGAASLFDSFTRSSEAAVQAQQKVATDLAFLNSAFRTGQVSAEQYATELKAIVNDANAAAAAFAEGARVTQQVATAEEKRAATLARLGELLQQGAISQQTYDRAAADASGANEAAAQAEEDRARALARAAQITQANLTPQQKYDQEVQELNQHLAAGRITQDTYNAALQRASQNYAKATTAAAKYDAAADGAGTGNTLAFNELSGILAAIPGPIGNVAGRLSGLASAGEGLGRVFSGGLSQGFGSLAQSVAGLANPFTAALASTAAFATGAKAIANGLIELEDRVESLGNLADQLGVSFEFVQVLEEAASRSGVSVESLTGAMTRLQKTLAGADEESKAAQDALGRLGVEIETLNGLSEEDQIRLIGDRLASIEDPAQRTAAAVALFGKSGSQLLPFFKNLGPAANDIERLGAGLDDIDRRNIDEFGAGLDALKVAIQGISQNLLTPFAGLAEGISQGLASAIAGLNAVIEPLGDIIAPFASAIGIVIEVVGQSVQVIGTLVGTALRPAAAVFQILGEVVEFFSDGMRAVNDAVNSVLQPLSDFFAFEGVVESFSQGLDYLGSVFERIARIIYQAVQNVINYLADLGQKILEIPIVGTAIIKFSEFLTAAFERIQQTLQSLKDGVEFFLGQAEEFVGVEEDINAVVDAAGNIVVGNPEGFNDFAKALASSRSELDKVIEESAQFGQAGFDAAFKFQQALADLQSQAEAGILNETAYQQEVAKATEAYRSQIDTIKEAAQEEERKAEAAKRAAEAAIEADQKRADAAVERLRVENEFGGDAQRAEAAENVLAIEREIIRVEEELAAARAANDQAAADAAAARLAQLDQAAARENDIASGAAKAREEAEKAAQKAADERQRKEEERQKKVADLQEQLQERLSEIEADRLDALSRRSQQALEGNDIRTSAGASQFLALATGREDPAVEEYRKQLRELQDIKREIAKANATTVEI